MYLFISNSDNAYYNTALELSLLEYSSIEILFIYINKPTIVIGRNQVIAREINHAYVNENNIPIIRRFSGGGTVYHDYGNINFSFIANREKKNEYNKWVVDFIKQEYGITLEFGSDNIKYEGKKVSGSAQYYKKDRYLHHLTLLVESNIETLNECLRNDKYEFYDAKGQISNKTDVENLNTFYPWINCEDIITKLCFNNKVLYSSDLNKNVFEKIDNNIKILQNDKWLDKNENYSLTYNTEFMGEELVLNLVVSNHIIKKMKILPNSIIDDKIFEGCRHTYNDVYNACNNSDICALLF